MRRGSLRIVLFVALLTGGCGDRASRMLGGFLPESIVVRQGQHVVIPRWPEEASIEWRNLSGVDAGYVSRNGSYHAPLTLASDRIVQIQATDGPRTAIVNVILGQGSVDGSDCLAPGEQDIRSDPTAVRYVEQLPEPVLRVPPSYPDLARQAGVDGTVLVRAFVCACGEVQNVEIVNSIPMLDDAAVEAVRHWIFVPALTNGEPATTWVMIPVKFSLH